MIIAAENRGYMNRLWYGHLRSSLIHEDLLVMGLPCVSRTQASSPYSRVLLPLCQEHLSEDGNDE